MAQSTPSVNDSTSKPAMSTPAVIAQNARRIYVDGVLRARAPFPHHRAFEGGPLFIGSGCLQYPGHTANSRMDEVALWDRPLDERSVRRLYALGRAGGPIAPAARDRVRSGGDGIEVVAPRGPEPPEAAPMRPRSGSAVRAATS